MTGETLAHGAPTRWARLYPHDLDLSLSHSLSLSLRAESESSAIHHRGVRSQWLAGNCGQDAHAGRPGRAEKRVCNLTRLGRYAAMLSRTRLGLRCKGADAASHAQRASIGPETLESARHDDTSTPFTVLEPRYLPQRPRRAPWAWQGMGRARS